MIDRRDSVIAALGEAWSKGVSLDCKNGLLWNGEVCIASSLAHHMRNVMADRLGNLKIWFEASFPKIRGGRAGRIDMVIASPQFPVDCETPGRWSKINKNLLDDGIIAAIEVKYANDAYLSDFQKIRALQELTPYDIVPIFAYVGYTTPEGNTSAQLSDLRKHSKTHNVQLLFGDPYETPWSTLIAP